MRNQTSKSKPRLQAADVAGFRAWPASFTPDGRYLVGVSASKRRSTVVVYDTTTGLLERHFPGEFSPMVVPSYLVTRSDTAGAVIVRDLKTWRVRFSIPSKPVQPFYSSEREWSVDLERPKFYGAGQFVARFNKKGVDVWDIRQRKKILFIPPPKGCTSAKIRFAQTNALVAVNWTGCTASYTDEGHDKAQIWDLAKRLLLFTRSGIAGPFSKDGSLIAVSTTTVRVFETASGKSIHPKVLKRVFAKCVLSIQFSHDNQYLIGTLCGCPTAVVDLRSGKTLEVPSNPDWVNSLGGGQIVSWDNGRISVWKRQRVSGPYGSLKLLRRMRDAVGYPNFFGWELDSTRSRIAILTDTGVFVWSLADGKRIRQDKLGARQAVFDRKGLRLVTSGLDGGLRLMSLTDATSERDQTFGLGGRTSLAFHPQMEDIVVGSSDGALTLWSLSGAHPPRVTRAGMPLRSLAYTPDGKTLVASSQGWLTQSEGDKTLTWTRHQRRLKRRKQKGQPWQYQLSQRCGRSVIDFRLVPFQVRHHRAGKQPAVQSVLFPKRSGIPLMAVSPDSHFAATIIHRSQGKGARKIRIWDTTNGKLLTPGCGKNRPCKPGQACGNGNCCLTCKQHATLVFNRQSNLLAAVDPSECKPNIYLVSLPSAQRQRIPKPPSREVRSLAFSPSGKLLAAASLDSTITLYDVATRKRLAVFRGHTEEVNDLQFTPNGSLLASASGDGTVKLWDVARRKLQATLLSNEKGDWVVFTPDGYLDGNDGGKKLVEWRQGSRRLSAGSRWTQRKVAGLLKRIVAGDGSFRR